MESKSKHYFFDMDGTLAESRSVCTPEMDKALRALARVHDVIIISGAERSQMKKQLPFIGKILNSFVYKFYVLSQSGTDAMQGRKRLWLRKLSRFHHSVISSHINVIKSLIEDEIIDPNDLVEDRGGQVAYSILGHNAPKEKKAAYDPDGKKRTALLEQYPLESQYVQVRIGGTTCLDYTAQGWGKAGNIGYLLGVNRWKIEDCVYVGDQLYEGGNDHEMIALFGKDRVKEVSGPDETLAFINSILAV